MADKKKVLEVTDRELAIIYASVAHVNSHRYPELTVGFGWRMPRSSASTMPCGSTGGREASRR